MIPGEMGGWIHALNPMLVRFTDTFGLRWYSLAYIFGFLVGYLILRALAKKGVARIPVDRVPDVMMLFVLGVLLGGRVGYIVVYEPSLLWTFEPSPPWWGALMIHRGGMSSHGGMAGVILAAIWVARGWRDESRPESSARIGSMPFLHITDLAALMVPFGLFFGRVANFINGELLGKVVAQPGEPSPWWGVRFPQELLTNHAPKLSAVQQDELYTLVTRYRLPNEDADDTLVRMVARVAEGDRGLAIALEPLLAARHASQLYQALAEGLVLGVVIWIFAIRPRVTGMIGALFLALYGVLRIGTETVRLPDDQFIQSARVLGLSRGQWLSAAMILGAAVIVVLLRRSTDRWPGLRPSSNAQPSS